MKLTFIGGGNMARALIAGLKMQQFTMTDIAVIEPDETKHEALRTQYGVIVTETLKDLTSSDVVILAVKPQHLAQLAKNLAPILSNQLIISIAAGVQLKELSQWLNNYDIIVRAMPNTPAQIQSGITGLYALPKVSSTQIAMADQVLSAVGTTLWLESEQKLNAVTAISGSGPAYVFYFIEALEAAAVSLGLNKTEAKQLSIATFKGAGLLADASDVSVSILREQVTSRGGTTEQGLISLQKSHVKEAIMLAAKKAYERAIIIGQELAELKK
ncbi:MAG TPA: pyrroline-5-carboxylate reductase [Methylophilaceae bacterium]|nr:pyrroline-5-carboxylate reductase [Methylophilaceae bacterium]